MSKQNNATRKPRRLTDAQYARSGGSICPECRAVNQLTAGRHEADGALVEFEVCCEKCGFTFRDIYKLIGYREAT